MIKKENLGYTIGTIMGLFILLFAGMPSDICLSLVLGMNLGYYSRVKLEKKK